MEPSNYSSNQHTSLSSVHTQPPPYNTLSPEDAEQENALLGETIAWIPKSLVTPEVRAKELMKPVVIPRVDTVGRLSIPLPFMRAYSPDLQAHDVNERDFIAFIDNLAVAQAAPVPLQALNMAGSTIGFVPHHWAMASGAGINVAAGVGTAAISILRTRYFMEKVNREYFGPRGLQASICKNAQLVEKLGHDPYLPVLAPLDFESVHTSLRDRRMQALAPYIAPLSLDLPPPMQQRNIIDKMSAKQIERKMKKKEEEQQKQGRKMRRKEAKRSGMGPELYANMDGYSSDSSSSSSSSFSSSSSSSSSYNSGFERREAKVGRADRRIERINHKAEVDLRSKGPRAAAKIEEKRRKRIEKVERKRRKSDRKFEKGMAKAEKKRDKALGNDAKKVDRMEFIIVEKLMVGQ